MIDFDFILSHGSRNPRFKPLEAMDTSMKAIYHHQDGTMILNVHRFCHHPKMITSRWGQKVQGISYLI